MIPRTLHYCFGLSSDFGDKAWSLVHHVCLRSAVERIKPTNVRFYCQHEPQGPWWELSRKVVTVEKVSAPREIFGNRVMHVAHQADVLRLEMLLERGGIYLDADVFVHQNFTNLLNNSTAMGEQRIGGSIRGLCNAVILSEAQSPFLARWHSAYRSFRSRGRDEHWDEHSVRIPYALSREFPSEITILPSTAFFWPTFSREDLALIFASKTPLDLRNTYATHLWESLAWEQYLQDLTPGTVRSVDTNFHSWARPMVADLPDDYGTPTGVARFASDLRKLRRRVRSAVRPARPTAASLV